MARLPNVNVELESTGVLPDVIANTQGVTFVNGEFWFTSNRDDTVSRMSIDLSTLQTFDVSAQTDLPLGIAHVDDHLWITATELNLILKYTKAGVYTGVSFSTESQTTYPDGICWDGAHFWVVGTGNFNAYQYTKEGVYTGVNFACLPLEGTGTVRDIAWDGSSFWVINSLGTTLGRIDRYNAEGVYTGYSIDALGNHGVAYFDGRLFVVGNAGSEWAIYTITEAPRTYDDLILDAEGVLGYYRGDTQDDLSGVHNQGSTIIGAGDGDTDSLTGVKGVKVPAASYDNPKSGYGSKVVIPTGTEALGFRIKAHNATSIDDCYSLFFGLMNSDNTKRLRCFYYYTDDNLLAYHNDYNARVETQRSKDAICVDCVLQFNGVETEFLIDGVVVFSESGNVFESQFTSYNFDTFSTTDNKYSGGGGSTSHVVFYNRPLTQKEISNRVVGNYSLGDIIHGTLLSSSIIWSNHETYAQANPQPINMFTALLDPVNNETVVKNNPFYADPLLDQNGEQRKFGYIASTTKINDIPVANKRVVIVANDTLQIIDETISDEFGNYRFDSLLLGKKYMITAQYGNADQFTPPEYSAVSSDWQTPTEY